jgi:hypothetical protein
MEPPPPAPAPPTTFACPDCEARNPLGAERCTTCHVLLDEKAWEEATEGYSGMIPSRNPMALWSYYLGIFSLAPLLGMFLGFFAVLFGRKGLQHAAARPEIKGRTHAWIGIVCGAVFGLANLVVILFLVIAALAR